MPANVKKSVLNLKESVRHKHEDSKVNYSMRECCFDRLKEIYEKTLEVVVSFKFVMKNFEIFLQGLSSFYFRK